MAEIMTYRMGFAWNLHIEVFDMTHDTYSIRILYRHVITGRHGAFT